MVIPVPLNQLARWEVTKPCCGYGPCSVLVGDLAVEAQHHHRGMSGEAGSGSSIHTIAGHSVHDQAAESVRREGGDARRLARSLQPGPQGLLPILRWEIQEVVIRPIQAIHHLGNNLGPKRYASTAILTAQCAHPGGLHLLPGG